MTLMLACGRTQPASTSPESSDSPAATPSNDAVEIDAGQLFETVSTLASDGLGGRYSLHREDIGRAADYIAKRFEDAGIAPVGATYRHDFSMVIGAELTSPPTLTAVRGGQRTEVSANDFTPLTLGGSGSVEGPVVFVGYGVTAAKDSAIPYDDLEGIDVEGKIALVLTETPNRPNARRMYRALRAIRRRFDSAASGLREAGDADALARLHRSHVEQMAELVRPFVGKAGLPPEATASPADPLQAELDITPFANAVFTPQAGPGQPQFGLRSGRLRSKVRRLVQRGATAVIVVQGPRTFIDADQREEDLLPALDETRQSDRVDVPVVRMRWKAADRVFRIAGLKLSALQKQIDQSYRPRSGDIAKTTASVHVEISPIEVPVPNVLATIPGRTRPDEVVVLGAHYDHIGTDEEGHGHCSAIEDGDARDRICNGADDNASGTAVVLETARVIAESGVRPERTLVFALFAAEELGLHGSKAIADAPPSSPPFDKGKVVAMLNIDMVGRLSEQGLFIGGVGSSPAWMPLLDRIGPRGIPTLYDASITSRSDHASFYKHGVPVLFFFTGVHDDYHAPGDESAAINRDGLTAITGLVRALTGELAAGVAIPFAEPTDSAHGLVGALPGDNPDTVVKRVGL